MAASSSNAPQPLASLVAYLFARREAILTHWRLVCEQDPALGKNSSLSREEFNNMLPLVLDILEQHLLGRLPKTNPAITAQAHGLHRWHKSYGLLETIQELNHLAQTLYGELNLFQQLFPYIEPTSLLSAQQQIAQLMQETINGSVQKYDELQRLQATQRAHTLQEIVEQMQSLSTQRGDMLRTSAHDLQSSFSIINSAAHLLKTEELSETDRNKFTDMLSRNLTSVQGMLTSLMDLSRLEAGQETLQIESVDAARLLRELVASAQPMATKRGIVLWSDGVDTLPVETDRVKLHRIAQNLLVNALKYTTSAPDRPAIVSVSWLVDSADRWVFSIQDSGTGLPSTTVSVFAQQLRPTVEASAVMGPDQAEPVAVVPDDVPQIPAPGAMDSATQPAKGGEGVGLQIVRRLCELLDANLDIETKEGRGTLVRIRMPVHPRV